MNIMTDYAYKGPQEFTQDWSQAERMRSLIAMEIMGKL